MNKCVNLIKSGCRVHDASSNMVRCDGSCGAFPWFSLIYSTTSIQGTLIEPMFILKGLIVTLQGFWHLREYLLQ